MSRRWQEIELLMSVRRSAAVSRELKHQAFLLSRRPTATKLSADVAYLNTSCGRGGRYGGLQAAFYLLVGLSELQSFFFIKGMASSTGQIVNKPLQVNNLLTITLTLTFASGSCRMFNQFYNLKFVYDWALQS